MQIKFAGHEQLLCDTKLLGIAPNPQIFWEILRAYVLLKDKHFKVKSLTETLTFSAGASQ